MRIKPVHRLICFALVLSSLFTAACGATPSNSQTIPPAPTLAASEVGGLNIVTGQTVFVPAYSEMFYGSGDRTLELTTTLAIHNTDVDDTIIVKSVVT
jgi:hypothetical protein